ncbi:M23 family metallopeptidase [Terrabacter sp. NPDC000476]|uniref:M23 family metallopeptidase n=1 Tax=Terrabacter sp. NPDC000476 TaxID=3154258 RepID=UPI0033216D76
MSGRLVPFALMLLVFALLPFLGGSTPQSPGATVVLAAAAPSEVDDAVAVVEQARTELSTTVTAASTAAAAPALSAFSDALGGGLFMFPAIILVPQTAEALAAPITGAPFFIHPVPGGESSPFGPRIHPLLGRPMFHTGLDLAASCGTPIRAAAAGTVVYARTSDSWGNRTIIQHSPSLKTAYGHQSRFLVTEGQTVTQGQVIGLVGTTGWSTGCHLHFDVIIDDRYVDPAPYLGFAPSSLGSVPYGAVPHLVVEPGGTGVHTVKDGDVPIPDPTGTGSTGGTPTHTPSQTPTATSTHTPSSSPTTSVPTTTAPTTSAPTTTAPTTTAPTTTATTTTAPTTTAPPTSGPTTSGPTSTTTAPTTTGPTTTDPTTSVPSSSAPTSSAPTSSTPTSSSPSSQDPTTSTSTTTAGTTHPSSERPSASATTALSTTAAEVLASATQSALATESATGSDGQTPGPTTSALERP